MKSKAFRYSAYTLLLVTILFFGTRTGLYYALESEAITTRPNDDEIPEDFGVPSRQFQFESGDRTLHASLVTAESSGSSTPALLLFHGRRETISRYAEVQAMLYRQGITSMVFDYSGFGSSTGEPTIDNLHSDGLAAWQYFTEHVASEDQPRIVLGHSLGTGILLSAAGRFNPTPDLIVLSAPWSTARDAVIHLEMVPEFTYYLLPDIWNNLEGARQLNIPLLVVHGTEDRIVPVAMGQQVAEAGGGRFIRLEGTGHRKLIRQPTPELWAPILDAIRSISK